MASLRFYEIKVLGNEHPRPNTWDMEDVLAEYRDVLLNGTEQDAIQFFAKYPLCAEEINTIILGDRDIRGSRIDVSAFSLTINYNRADIAQLLVERYGADVNVPPDGYRQGMVPVFLEQSPITIAACKMINFALANFLKDKKARMNTFVVQAVIDDALERAADDEEAQDVASKNLCEWLRNCFLRYPALKTNELETGDGKNMYWFQNIMRVATFNGMHRFIALFYSLGMYPTIDWYHPPNQASLMSQLAKRDTDPQDWSVKQMDSYLEAMYLIYVRLPEHNVPIEFDFIKWVDRIYPDMQDESKTRFSLLNNGMPCTPENMIDAWRADRHDHSTFQSTLLTLYSAKIIPRLSQSSPVRILPTDILLRLSEMLGHGHLKLPREMVIPSVFISAM